jgi:KDO2-lipid IV(A) lauroyltransferase
VRAEGYEYLDEALKNGRGVILATVHYGCPEIAVQAARAWGLHFLILIEPLQPVALSELFVRLRASHGHRAVPIGFDGLKEAMRTLRRGQAVLLVVDRDIQGRGVEVPFFGATTRMPSGAIELARATGATLIPVLSRRLANGGAVVTLQPPLSPTKSGNRDADLRLNVGALIQRFETQIRTDPGQWLVLEQIWKLRPANRGTHRS